MTPDFVVRTTPQFERLYRALKKKHPEGGKLQNDILTVLRSDPYNQSGRHNIKKLTGIPKGKGQFRLRMKRYRFRYDIHKQDVVLHFCGLRREDTYK